MARDRPQDRPVFDRARDFPMSPEERKALEKAVRVASGKQAFKKRRADLKAGKPRRSGFAPGVDSLFGKTVSNLVDAAIYTPAGIAEVTKAVGGDTRDLLTGRIREPGDIGKRSRQVGGAVAQGTAETVRHPLRRPGDTLLLGLAAFGGGAGLASRASATGQALKAGETLGRALTRPGYEGGSLLSRPVPGERLHRVGDMTVRGRYSASPGIRAIQKGIDRVEDRAAGTAPGEAYAIRKAGKELGFNRVVAEAAKRGPAKRLARMGRKLTKAQQQALRVWGQGLTVDQKIAQYQRELALVVADQDMPKRVKERLEKDLSKRIAVTEAARPYLDDTGEIADFTTPRRPGRAGRKGASTVQMRAIGRQALQVSGDTPGGRERILVEAGLIEPEQAAFRLHAPGRIALGAEWTTAAEDAIRRLSDIERRRKDLTPEPVVIPGKTITTKRPRTKQEWEDERRRRGLPVREERTPDEPTLSPDELRLADLDAVLDPLIDAWAAEIRGMGREAKKGQRQVGQDKYDYWIDRYGKEEGGRIAGLPDEDRKAEGFVQGERKGFANRKRDDARDTAEEMLSQVAGREPTSELDVNTLLAMHEALKSQGIDMAKLRKAMDERDELRAKMQAAVPDPEDVFGAPEPPAPPPPVAKAEVDPEYADIDEEGQLGLGVPGEQRSILGMAPVEHGVVPRDDGAPARAPAPPPAKPPQPVAKPEPDYGTVTVTRKEPDRIERPDLDAEAQAAMARLDEESFAAFEDLQRGNEPKLVGQEGFEGGRFRVPDVPMKQPGKPLVGKGSVYRGGEPKAPKSVTEGYTGTLERTGGFRINTTVETTRSALEAHKYVNLLDLRQQILRAGQERRPHDTKLVQWVPARVQRLTAKQRRMLTDQSPLPDSEHLPVAEGELAQVAGTPWEKFLEDVFPERHYANVPEGGKVPNVVWVPRQLLANMNKPFQRSPWAPAIAVLDTALNLVKFGVIPLKTAYVTANAAGNALFNVVQQGVFLPRNWQQAVRLLRDERTGPVLRELMGSGGMQALVSGNPRGLGVLNTALHGYANVMSELMLEPMMRGSALVHEMNRFGAKTTAQQYRLMTDPKRADDLAEITRRAKDAIIDYDRLGPMEKAVTRRALFIYPWVKGATLYAGHFLMEHPVQAGVYGALAKEGREEALRELGPVPSYARGSFRVGGSDEFPLGVNPSTISPLSQAAEIGAVALGSLTGEGGGADQVGGLLHPMIQAGIEAAFKRDLFTGAPLQGSFLDLLVGRSLKQTAPATLTENLKKADRPPGRRAFPMTREQALLRTGVGSFMPRTYNRKVLNEAERTEREHDLKPGQRARRKVFRERQDIFQTMKQRNPELLDRNGRLPAPVRKAYNRKAEVEAARREAMSGAHGDSLVYYRTVAVAEARLLERWGALPKGTAARIKRRVGSMELEAVKQGVQRMRDDLAPDAYRDITSAGNRYLERAGG